VIAVHPAPPLGFAPAGSSWRHHSRYRRSVRRPLAFRATVAENGGGAPRPYLGELAGARHQEPTGRPLQPHSGEDQETAVVDDVRQLERPPCRPPADLAVLSCHLRRRAGLLDLGQHGVAPSGVTAHPPAPGSLGSGSTRSTPSRGGYRRWVLRRSNSSRTPKRSVRGKCFRPRLLK